MCPSSPNDHTVARSNSTAHSNAPGCSAPCAVRLCTRDASVGVAAGSAAAASRAASRAARSLSAAVSARNGWSSSCGQSSRRDGCFSSRPCQAGRGSRCQGPSHTHEGRMGRLPMRERSERSGGAVQACAREASPAQQQTHLESNKLTWRKEANSGDMVSGYLTGSRTCTQGGPARDALVTRQLHAASCLCASKLTCLALTSCPRVRATPSAPAANMHTQRQPPIPSPSGSQSA